jgi:branched-chain amino acid aminotransferase
MAYEIKIEKAKSSRIDEVDFHNIPFGKIFADHMLICDYKEGKWHEANILPFQSIPFSPATAALHYGQEIFEGMKAYKNADGKAMIFRPEMNYRRFNKSALRMCMPELSEGLFIDGLKQLIALDQSWIPTEEGSSLYIRPFMIATDEFVGIRPSESYKFIIFSSPVAKYYPEPIKVKIEEKYTRAAHGGTGAAKNAGNYGASLYPTAIAMQEGYKQLLWTDDIEHKWIEESGTMNVFFIIGDTAITPALDGNILDGVTRNSVITLLRDKGLTVEERLVSVDEIVEAHRAGTLFEAFGTGTAATIAHITDIGYKGEDLRLPEVAQRKYSPWLLEEMEGIKRGRNVDRYNWMTMVD